MPIQANEGVLDIENATLRSNAIVTLTNFVAGNDVVRSLNAPTLEVYGDPNNGGTEPTIEIVSNVDAGASSTFTRLTSNAGVFTIQSGTNAATDSRGDIAFTSIGGATETEHMRIHGSTGNVYVSSNLEVGTANLFVDTVNSRVGLGTTTPLRTLDIVGDIGVTANTSIFVGSNVVAEYTGPHDRPLRKYPEVAMTANDNSSTSGYTVTTSSNESSTHAGWKAFNDVNGINYTTSFTTGNNTFSAGTAAVSRTTGSDTFNHEWLELTLPKSIYLTEIDIYKRGPDTDNANQPKTGRVYGSNGGGVYDLLFTYSDLTYNGLTTPTKVFNPNTTKQYYKIYRLVITEIFDSTNRVSIGEMDFYGHEEGDSSLDTTLKSVYNVPGTQQLEVYYDAKDLADGAVSTTSGAITGLGGTTINGTAFGDPQVSNGAFVFDGVGDFIESGTLNLTGDAVHSISVWFNANQVNNLRTIVDVTNTTTNLGQLTHAAIRIHNGKLNNHFYSDDITSSVDILANVWYHAVTTYQGGGSNTTNRKTYLNGVEITEFSLDGTTGGDLSLTSPTLCLGRDQVRNANQFDGNIGNVRLFSKALNADQIKELYDYQKDYFLGTRSSVTLYKGHLGIGVAEPSGQLELAGDERIQEYPPRIMTDYEMLMEGHGVFCVSASSNHPNYKPWFAFDGATQHGSNDNSWISGTTALYDNASTGLPTSIAARTTVNGGVLAGEWIQMSFPYKIYFKQIALAAQTDSEQFRAPKDATIVGSNDGVTWDTLHTFTNQTSWTDNQYNYYTMDGNIDKAYKYVRIIIQRVQGSSTYTALAEVKFFGTPGPTTLDKGSLTLGRSLDVPRISRYDVDTETPRPEKLLLDFDTTVNSSPTDISGQGNHGAFYGGASYSAADKAFDLDGSNDAILGIISNPAGDWVHSISFWFKLDIDQSTISTVKTENRIQPFQIATQGTGGVGRTTNLASGDLTGHVSGLDVVNSTFNWYFYGNDASFPISGIKANEWHHLTLAYEGGGAAANRHSFLDGVEFLNTGSSSANLDVFANSILSIGKDHARTASSPSYFPGQISNFKIYNVALEASEVQKLYRLGRTGRSMVISDTAVGIGKVPEAQLDVRGTFKTSNMSVDGEAITFYNKNNGTGIDYAASALLNDYSAWTSIFSKSWIGGSAGWGTFWAGNSGAAYRKDETDTNPNEYVFVGNGNKRHTFDLNNGNAYFDGTLENTSYDYAEYFEWEDGNPDNDDRRGYSVVLGENGKIKKATGDDEPSDIFGIVSGTSGIIGDAAGYDWHGKYEVDEWGTKVTDEVYQLTWTEDDQNHSYDEDRVPEGITVPENVSRRLHNRERITPGYDDTKQYIPRDKRKEWCTVGLLGKVRLRDGSPKNPNWRYLKTIAGKELWLIR